jgi:hypothetical protein
MANPFTGTIYAVSSYSNGSLTLGNSLGYEFIGGNGIYLNLLSNGSTTTADYGDDLGGDIPLTYIGAVYRGTTAEGILVSAGALIISSPARPTPDSAELIPFTPT